MPNVPSSEQKGKLSFAIGRKLVLRVVLGASVLFLVAILILGGLAFPTVAERSVLGFVKKQGLEGSLEVTGSLWSGFSIQNLSLKGKGSPIQSVTLEDAEVRYRFNRILTGFSDFKWLDLVSVKNLDLHLILPEKQAVQKPVNAPKPRKSPKAGTASYSSFWNLMEAEIDLKEISAQVEAGGKHYQVDDLAFDFSNGIRIDRLKLAEFPERVDIAIPIKTRERALTLGPVSIVENVNLSELKLSERSPEVVEIDAALQAAGSDILAQFSTVGEARLSLAEGQKVDLGEIKALDSKVTGWLSNLKFDFTGDFSRPESWKIFGIGNFEKVSISGFVIDEAGFKVVGDKVNLELERSDATIVADAVVPLLGGGQSSDPIVVNADILVSSINSLLKTVAQQYPVDGTLKGGISNLRIGEGNSLQGGHIFLKTDETTWSGQAIDGLESKLTVVSPSQIDIFARASLSPNNHFNVKGDLNPETLSYQTKGILEVKTDNRLVELLAFSGADQFFKGVAKANWSGQGSIKTKDHRGSISCDIPGLSILKGKPFTGAIVADYDGNTANLSQLSLARPEAAIEATARWDGQSIEVPQLRVLEQQVPRATLSAQIPFPKDDSGKVAVNLQTSDLALSSIAGFFMEDLPLECALSGDLKSEGSLSRLDTKADFKLVPQSKGEADNSQLSIDLQHSGNVVNPSTWDMKLAALMSGLRWKETRLENLSLNVDTVDNGGQRVALANLSADQSTASVRAKASVGLTQATDFASLVKEPIAVDGTVTIGMLENMIRDFAPGKLPLSGGVDLKISDLELHGGELREGSLTLNSETLAFDQVALGAINIGVDVTSPGYVEGKVSLPLDENSELEGSGVYDIQKGGYAGKVAVKADLKSQGILRQILSTRNFAALLPADTTINWQGKGSVPDKIHLGSFEAMGEGLALSAGGELVDFSLSGNYTEDSAVIPDFKLKSRPIQLAGNLEWKDHRLKIPSLTGTHSGRKVLDLSADIPVDPEKLTPELWFQQRDELALKINTDGLPIAEVSKLFKPETPLSGDLDVTLNALGSPAKPVIKGNLDVTNIVVAQKDSQLPVGKLSVDLAAENDQAKLKGEYRHPDVKPFVLNAALPFFPGAWAAGTRTFVKETIVASAKMDKSSLSFLESQVPEVEQVDGTAAIDVKLTGSISEPKLLGNGAIDITRLRLKNRNAPTFYDIDSAIRFTDNTLNVDRLHAIVSGGVVDISGKAILDGENPRLDFKVLGQEVLVARTPDVNVRTDVDLTLTGPWKEARLAGSLGITNSRFFKNVDLIPMGLPNRRKSVLPTVERVPSGGGPAKVDLNIGVPIEPFKNWPVTVHISTKDPFLIRGNLAQSEVDADLVILGTLGKPYPKGVVKLKEGELTLPFSKVDVEVGEVVFSEATGFNGALEFKARATAGDYKVNIYAFNRILEPKHVLTSIPPIASEDIMTLLATGTTRDELVGADAGSVAASKAALLFLKNLKKSSDEADRGPSLIDKLQDRTELELGKVDPKTGIQSFGGKIRLWKQFFFVGDVDAQSDYRALVKYVFKYR
ncbi:MAG: translocation/assembly module TamB domain-containing protein [Verrucomicrobiales bacterium]|nr:translocation/assembly module TamB domain-containing protein [Verrucomicrobiales bacterium]